MTILIGKNYELKKVEILNFWGIKTDMSFVFTEDVTNENST